ncbi:MAG: hypothetical protein M5U12_24010 [Verrucomicrobia bacterium]|nr:hypothetical protein [Verrucomicrobiota bacterium]
MIYEFAAEPEVMVTWEHFHVIWNGTGASQGRLLVEYPQSWRKQTYALADKLSPAVRANAICSRLSDPEQRHRLVGSGGRPYDPRRGGWLANAVADHGPGRGFRAVAARQVIAGCSPVVAADDVEGETALWKAERQDKACPRRAAEMCQHVRTLLCHSSVMVLVDRFFDPCEPRFTRPFGQFVRVHTGWRRLELHTSRRGSFRRDIQQANYRSKLEPTVPSGADLVVCFWPDLPATARMHPRFVLTERGGVHFDVGLDEGPGTALVSLLEHEVFLQFWKDYHPNSQVFGSREVATVSGLG